ncbi:MAG: sirohydrochlorin chelatase [Hydrococcus sp. Prado102]|nr:sirohydrochlorin chelatase [Hydrococcus sp. Prado102]
MRSASAYLLVSHGSRDPRPQLATERLASLLIQKLERQQATDRLSYYQSDERKSDTKTALRNQLAKPIVETACLELAPVSLHVRIEECARKAKERGLESLEILPLFLLPGVHVREDIPGEIAIAQQALRGAVKLELRPYLGNYPDIIHILTKKLEKLPAQARIILSHGSRRQGANQPCEAIAARLDAVTAYWSLSPSVSEQVKVLAESGSESIAILPYFLFWGGIIDAIASQVQQLQIAYPKIQLHLGEPLGATEELADLILTGIDE